MANLKDILGDAFRQDMTVADIESAIAGMKLADLSTGQYVSIGKLNDYEARMKKAEKELNERLTAEEKAQAEQAKIAEHYKAIEKENALYKFTAKLAKTIKDEAVLKEVAGLYADGDFATAIDKQNEYIAKERADMEKVIKADLMKKNPEFSPKNDDKAITKEKFKGMSLFEKQELANTQPELYKQLTNQ